MALVNCPECGRHLLKGEDKCYNCGFSLIETTESIASDLSLINKKEKYSEKEKIISDDYIVINNENSVNRCPECNGILSVNAKICPHCGAPNIKKRKESAKKLIIFGGILIVIWIILLAKSSDLEIAARFSSSAVARLFPLLALRYIAFLSGMITLIIGVIKSVKK